MNFKKSKKALIASASLLGVLASTPVLVYGLQNNTSYSNDDGLNNLDVVGSNSDATTNQVKPLVPAQANGQNSFLSTTQGPLVYWNNTIKSLDWFGALRWSIDFGSKYDGEGEFNGKDLANGSPWNNGAWKRAWFNWDYDRVNNILWVLTYGSSTIKQKFVSIDASNGQVTGIYENSSGTEFRFISALSSGNVIAYGGAGTSYNAKALLWEKNTKGFKDINGNSAVSSVLPTITPPEGKTYNASFYLSNIVPIKSGYNLVEITHYSAQTGTRNDDGFKYASYKVFFILVNDNLDLIATGNSQWTKAVEVISDGIPGFRNSTITPQRDYYSLVNNNVVTVIYNTVVIINPYDSTADNGISIKKYLTTNENKWILSWSFDTKENLFYKFKDDSKIYRVSTDSLTNTANNSLISASTYFDLVDAQQGDGKISKYAKNFILYNVYGYQGQIMLINSWYSDTINNSSAPKVETSNDNEYGLAVAITQNTKNNEAGDSKGLLNTDKAFQFSADFEIPEETLKNKLPSEITRNDLKFYNDGFLTTNTKYTSNPFVKEMDDENGVLKVTAYVDQIPWFVTDNKMPTNIPPTQITKEYDILNKVSTRIEWKLANVNTDYDFVNTLPSKVEISDLQRFDPAVFNINSQEVKDANGTTIYPKKEYKIDSAVDETGKITVTATYTYIPLDVDATKDNAKTVTSTHTYDIFKTSDEKKFSFIGGSNNSVINIQNVPQLAGLLESDMLPSTFVNQANQDTTKQLFLQFINTNSSTGYPTSKMTFNAVPNDNLGTLSITAKLPDNYYSGEASNSYTITYQGLHKTNDYSFSLFDSPRNINTSSVLASSINVESIFSNFVSYKGFNPLDFDVVLTPNDVEGKLILTFTLNGNYPENIKKTAGFSKSGNSYVQTKTYTGFMTKEQQNNQYKFFFKKDGDTSLNELKKLTPQEVKTKLEAGNLEVDGKTYKSVADLVENLLKDSRGVSLPAANASGVTAEMVINNGNGTATFIIKYPKSVLNNKTDSDLTFVGEFTGFALGNDKPTSDVFSFKNQTLLQATNPDFFKLKASEVKNWLAAKDNLQSIISFTSGQYQNLIDDGSYTLTVSPNLILGKVSIKITFNPGTLTDKDSLYSYAVTYEGLVKE